MKKFNFLFCFLTISLLFSIQVSFAQTSAALAPNTGVSDVLGSEKCGTMPGVLQRVANDPAYAAIYNQHRADLDAGVFRSADPCATPIVVPVAFHFDESFSCADPVCLVSEIEESLIAVNEAFADNSQNQLVQSLVSACPEGYALADISTGSCISFCLAEPRAPFFNQGLDPACDPSITIGSFCGGNNFCGDADGGAPPYYGGILNIFIVGDDGSGLLGVADGIPGAANGDGVTVLGSVFGADGVGCISGGPINTSGLFGGGATLAHEIGHYLGLFHIWADDAGGCAFDDGISDTPQQGDNNQNLFPCPTVGTTCAGLPQSCGSFDYYHNFMDYTSDNCLVMFTQEQAQVMNATANQLFGATTATCDNDPIVLTSLCEQTVCDPACDFVADITSACDADGLNYTVTVIITGGTGPFDVNETADNDPTIVETVLATGLTAGTYTYSFAAGTNSNIVVVDNGIADCFDGQFIFNPCAMCDFTVEFDYDNVTCNDFGGTLLPTIPIIVTPSEPGVSIVWIDQDGNTTFDAADIEITNGGNIGFPTSDLTFIVYDSGAEDCFATYTVESGNFSCDGVVAGAAPLRVCTFTAEADLVDFTCNGDGTATVNIKVDKIAGNLSVLAGGATQVSAVADSAEFVVTVPVGAACGVTSVTFADDGSDVSMDSGVSITAPTVIAGMITSVGTNASADWGVDIATVSPPVCGTLAPANDGTDPISDFCEPTPPATPTAAQCAALSGNIAIIDRGTCAFTEKSENAQACGAIAVVICNNDVDNPDAILTMAGTSVSPVTIPTIFLSYNQCQQIYVNLNNAPVDMCIGAPVDVPCERTVNIDACTLICDAPEYCDNPCFAEFDPAGTGTPNSALCVTALGCADSPDAACLTAGVACDDMDCNTENDVASTVTATGEVCDCAGTPVTVVCDDGCDLTTDTYDSADCSCTSTNPDPDDNCALTTDVFDAATCTITSTPNCAANEMFDAPSCTCVSNPIPGCTDPCDPNFDPAATVSDPALCAGYDDTCNADCTAGSFGGTFDTATCACINETVPVNGCTDATAANFDAAANCDDGSCTFAPCEDSISGTIFSGEPNCDLTGIMVEILDDMGNPVAGSPASVLADGSYSLVGSFPCGTYTATLLAGTIPDCYSNLNGTTGPSEFVINGDGIADGAGFTTLPQIPTLSQWGLISLALLLMIFGAVKISATSLTVTRVRK